MVKSKKQFHHLTADNYFELLNFKFVEKISDLKSSQKALFLIRISAFRKNITPTNLDPLLKEISSYLNNITHVVIPVIDFEHVNVRDEHLLWTFLDDLQKIISSNSLIVINIASYVVEHAVNNLKNDGDIFWNKEKFIILYPFERDEFGNVIYYTEILGGLNLLEYRILRNKLDSTHFTCKPKEWDIEINELSFETARRIEEAGIFFNQSAILQNFELIITYKNKTLFEHSMSYILNTNADIKLNDFSGYKIINSHFRLGSKVHIRDFVYAKRIFQNSFFTNRFAFLSAKYFLETYPGKNSVTIVSYGLYSQLLVNRIEKILQKHTNGDVNHNIVSDSEDPHFIKNIKWNSNVFVIVPINTTFSTTIKIENLVREQINHLHKYNISVSLIKPSFNLILVTHGNIYDEEYTKKLNTFLRKGEPFFHNQKQFNPPYKVLNWKNVNIKEKIIEVETNPPNTIRTEQKFLLTVPSELYLPDNCHLCFPGYNSGDKRKDILNEELLFKTDKVSVTPQMTFDIPQNFMGRSRSFDQSVYINQEAHYWGHFVSENTHYSHFIDPIPFFEKYPEKIKQWGKSCRERLHGAAPDILSSGVLLLSAGNRNNTYFTDFINRIIFDDSAVIIHYDVTGNYIDNFVKFFTPHVNLSKYIFIVDDIINNGETINKLNDVILFCNNRKKSCDGVITLISSANDYSLINIKSQLNNTFKEKLKYSAFYYLNLELGTIENCPLCLLKQHYEKMAQDSILDSVKHYFLNKALRLKVENISDILQNKYKSQNQTSKIGAKLSERVGWSRYNPLVGNVNDLLLEKDKSIISKQLYQSFQLQILPDKNYLRLLVSHELNRILSFDSDIRDELMLPYNKQKDFEKDKIRTIRLFNTIINKIKIRNPFEGWYKHFNEATKKISDEIINELILAILTEQSFLTVKPIKEKVFFWIIIQLDPLIDNYKTTDKSFPIFRKIKFLLKKTALLGSNYSIHPLTMERIKNIYKGYDPREGDFKNLWAGKMNQANRIIDLFEKKEGSGLKDRKKYIAQIEKNIQYIEVSLREFGYFFLAILKETTIDSDASIIKLEKTVDQILLMTDPDSETDFFYFLRLIKFENAFILKRGTQNIYDSLSTELTDKLSFNYREKTIVSLLEGLSIDPKLQNEIDAEISFMFDDYRLIGLKNYLGINSSFLNWKKSSFADYVKFIELIYLYSLLKNDEKKSSKQISLEARTQTIIQHFFFLAGNAKLIRNNNQHLLYKETRDSGAYLVLRLNDGDDKYISHEKLLVSAVTKPYKPTHVYEIINAPIDDKSLTYIMFNGVSNKDYSRVEGDPQFIRDVKKPWILWELHREPFADDSLWYSHRGKVFPIESKVREHFTKLKIEDKNGIQVFKDFTESVFLQSNVNSLKFIRFTNVFVNNEEIVNEVNAVIGLFTEYSPIELARQIEIKKMCFAYAVLPLINNFINIHYDSSILSSLRNSWKKLIEKDKFKHGQNGFLDNYRMLLEEPKKDEDSKYLIELLHTLLKYANNIPELLDNYLEVESNQFKNYELYKNLDIKKGNSSEIMKMLMDFYNIVIRNRFGPTKAKKIVPIIQCESSMKRKVFVNFSQTLLSFLLSEIFINAKKNSSGKRYFLKLYLFKNEKNWLMLSITNNCGFRELKLIDKLNKPIANSTRGLGLVDHITSTIFDVLSKKEINSNPTGESIGSSEFTLTLPIARII